MVQIPDTIKPVITGLTKHHFWLLAPLVPLVLLLPLSLATGDMQAKIAARRQQIEGKITAIKSVHQVNPHPNEQWSKDIDASAARVRSETFREWQRFWESQASLRVWPAELGNDFVRAASALPPDGRLDAALLQRYQNRIPDVVRKFPGRMGAAAAMVVAAKPEPRAAGGFQLEWDPADQQRLYASFKWDAQPSTEKVVLAQEELWVQGLLCDAIARANRDATGIYDAAIQSVSTLQVGYPAAEDTPGGAGAKRIVVPDLPPPPPGKAPPPLPPVVDHGAGTRPANSRFTPSAAPAPVAEEEGNVTADTAPPDPSLREWIYVDFAGRPLRSAELATLPPVRMVHLVPFVCQLVIDQRRLDALLADLASGPIPIDVRHVRINVEAGAAGIDRDALPLRRHDIKVELRGTVALATPPDPKVLGLDLTPPAASHGPAGLYPSLVDLPPSPRGARCGGFARRRDGDSERGAGGTT